MKRYLVLGAIIITLLVMEINIDPRLKALYDAINKLTASLTRVQKNSIAAIFNEWVIKDGIDYRKLFYVIATTYHECRFRPIKEIRATKGTPVYQLQEKYWYTGFYGRGFVQLTWEKNYDTMGKRIGVDLVRYPDLALDIPIAAKIIITGMYEGLFTGKKLSDYINSNKFDYTNARRIVNGTDKAALIASYADVFQRNYNNQV